MVDRIATPQRPLTTTVPRIHHVKQHKLAVRGIEAMTLVSNHYFPRHSHDQFGIGVIAFGAQRSWSGVGSVSACAGDVIMANPGEIHDGAPLQGNVRGWRMIYLDPAIINRELREEFTGEIEIDRPVARDPALAAHFARLFSCLTVCPLDRFAEEENLLRVLMCLLHRYMMTQPAHAKPTPSVAKAVERLDSAPGAQVSLAELAALTGVSRFQLLRAFAREKGITPHAYLIQRRVCLARRLLAEGQTPVQAALIAGFADQSHLTRVFVRQVGITPSRYRAAIA
jgi:AraC-like DNA-binding protein